MLEAAWQRVTEGATVTLRPRGNSMRPKIRSGDEVVVAPCRPERLEVGDIVLVRVAGSTYLHQVSAIDATRARYQISNAAGRVNGWVKAGAIAGICTQVEGCVRRGALAKRRETQD